MTASVQLAVDVMSGDSGLRTSLPAAELALADDPNLSLLLVGDATRLTSWVPAAFADRVSVVNSPAILPMDADPVALLRSKQETSLSATIEVVADGRAQGLVSAGNTGALMVLSRQRLGVMPGCSRPALCTALPLEAANSYLLDLGANVDCRASQLLEFAHLGAALVESMHGLTAPRIALLSNGHEPGKGNDQIRLAQQYLGEDSQLNFIGYIEADQLLGAAADVIVCDGLLGNVALKAMEGTARAVAAELDSRLQASLPGRLLAKLAAASLQAWSESVDPASYSGAFLLGLEGVVVKSHGHSSSEQFARAIAQAAQCVRNSMVPAMQQHLKM